MTTLYDTSTEVDTAEAERLLRRPAKQVRNLWRAGLLKVAISAAVLLFGVLWESDATDYPEGNIND